MSDLLMTTGFYSPLAVYTLFSAWDIDGLAGRDPALISKPFYVYDFMVLTCPAQYSKIELCATCFCLREDFCKDRLCLYADIRNKRISSRNTRISPKFPSKRQFQRVLRGEETVYIPSMYWQPLIKRLKTSCWLSQAAWPRKDICREPSKGFLQLCEMRWWQVTGISRIAHRKQKYLPSELKKVINNKSQTNSRKLVSYFSITLSSSIRAGVTLQQTHEPINSGHNAKKKYQPTTCFWWQISAISVVHKGPEMHIFVSPKQ